MKMKKLVDLQVLIGYWNIPTVIENFHKLYGEDVEIKIFESKELNRWILQAWK